MGLKALIQRNRFGKKLKNGDRIQIKPLTLKQSLAIGAMFEPLADAVVRDGALSMQVQVDNASELIGIVATAIDKPYEYVENMDTQDFQEIYGRLLKVNSDFFNAQVRAAAARAKQKSLPPNSGAT